MTIIEQIRAEIERRIALFSSLSEDTVNPNRIDEDRQLLSFLDTLEEQEVKPDEEPKNAAEEYCPDDAYPFAPEIFRKELRKAFIAGYKYHEEHTPLPEDSVAFNKGVEEGKRLMREEAMEVKVGMHGEPIEITLDKYVQRAMGIFPGDKVRIIVLKNTEK